jgi:predicted nucleic acid-binding protein
MLSRVGTGAYEIVVSVPLVLEYEDVLMRQLAEVPLTGDDVAALVDYICSVAVHQEIYFLWRPQLRDAGDDLVLELAVAAGCDAVVTHNVRDFVGASRFNVQVLTPAAFLKMLRSSE